MKKSTIFVFTMLFAFLIPLNFNNVNAATTLLTETVESCLAGTDLDGDDLTGVADPDCAAFAPVATTTPPVVQTPTPTTSGGTSGPSFGGGSGPSFGSSFGGGLTSGTPISNITSGTPISATSSEPVCAEMFKTYMKKGNKNNVAEVKKLQSYLNRYLNLKIPNTGFFGNMTSNGVKAFQLKYQDTILAPWGITKATGYFYKTTQRQMNLLLCSTANIPMPVLN